MLKKKEEEKNLEILVLYSIPRRGGKAIGGELEKKKFKKPAFSKATVIGRREQILVFRREKKRSWRG